MRYQAFHYAKGIGPVVIRMTGDGANPVALAELGIAANTPDGFVNEEFHLVRHNLAGCPGYDASLPALPPNSGNVCSKFYSPTQATALTMTEYVNTQFDYYFMTSRVDEKAILAQYANLGWTPTGKSFTTVSAPGPGLVPIHRFFFPKVAKNRSRGMHFYTLLPSEIDLMNFYNVIVPSCDNVPYGKACYEGVDSYAYPPGGTESAPTCPQGTVPMYRAFRGNLRFPDDPNHRFTTDKSIYDAAVAAGWDAEGIKACLPPNP